MTEAFELNLRHLRALSLIAAHGTLSAAAAAASLSQPALTQGLAKLERRIGQTLFERRSDGVSATPAGRALSQRVVAAFEQLDAASRPTPRSGPRRGFAQPSALMTGTQANAFLRLAVAGSFVDAARAAALSQPALHRAVRDLEQICGRVLVERRGRGVALTPAGRRLARGLRLAAAEISAGLEEIRGDGLGARIAVGAMPLSRALVLPRAILALLQNHPAARVEVFEGAWRDLVETLRDGVIDVMVGALRELTPAGLLQQPLFEDRLTVVGRAGHPLAGGAAPTLDQFAAQGWIIGQTGTPLRAQWEALFAERTSWPSAPVECASVMVIRGLLAGSDLLTVLSPDQVALEISSGVLTTIDSPLDQGGRTIGVTTRADWRPTAQQSAFLDHLRDAVERTRVQEKK